MELYDVRVFQSEILKYLYAYLECRVMQRIMLQPNGPVA